jgi:hypothetical protein
MLLTVYLYPSSYRDFSKQYRKEIRHFWDGGLTTNTPLTELVILHRDYWHKIRGLKDKVPTLTVGVINVQHNLISRFNEAQCVYVHLWFSF